MNNDQLSNLVELYFDCKKRLNEIKGQAEKEKLKVDVLNETGALLRDKLKTPLNGSKKIFIEMLISKILPDQIIKAQLIVDEAIKQITLPANENDILYLDTKLEAIKALLGEDNCRAIEAYEKERILKNK